MSSVYERKIARSAKRIAKAKGIFKVIEEALTQEAQAQHELHALLEADYQANHENFIAQLEALEARHLQEQQEIEALQDQARHHGLSAERGAEALRGLFV